MAKVALFHFHYRFSEEVWFVFKVSKAFETKYWHLSLAACIWDATRKEQALQMFEILHCRNTTWLVQGIFCCAKMKFYLAKHLFL